MYILKWVHSKICVISINNYIFQILVSLYLLLMVAIENIVLFHLLFTFFQIFLILFTFWDKMVLEFVYINLFCYKGSNKEKYQYTSCGKSPASKCGVISFQDFLFVLSCFHTKIWTFFRLLIKASLSICAYFIFYLKITYCVF